METYRYDETNVRETLTSELDSMTTKELMAAEEAIREIRIAESRERAERMSAWFDQTILPILKEFAREHSAALEIERDQYLITATLQSAYFQISKGNTYMHFLLAAAEDVVFDTKENQAILALVFDYGRQPAPFNKEAAHIRPTQRGF